MFVNWGSMIVEKLRYLENPRRRVGPVEARDVELHPGGGKGEGTDKGSGFEGVKAGENIV